MAKNQNKTVANDVPVCEFLDTIEDLQCREDCYALMNMMQEISTEAPKMWGSSIVGFGTYHYKYASGREGDFLRIGFAPRKRNISIYLMSGFDPHQDLMSKLGTYKTGVACLYIKKLSDIDTTVLRELIKKSLVWLKEYYGN